MKKQILTDVAVVITLLIMGFVGGYLYSQFGVINRAQELLKQNRVEYDGADIEYISLGTKTK